MKNTKANTKKVMMARRRRFFTTIFIVIIVFIFTTALWTKSHKTYICDISFINDNIVYVIHPNGLTYGVAVDNDEDYENLLQAKVTFNELTDWEKNYTINNIKPYIDGGMFIIEK